MKFIVYPEVFEGLPNVCFAVVAAYGIDNRVWEQEAKELLRTSMEKIREEIGDTDIKTNRKIVPYRMAFSKLGYNPNKYMSSIEAMVKRVAKGGVLPSINPVVDLANAVSMEYMLPMGAHDMDALEGDIAVRFATEGDTFIPLGETEQEAVEPGELVYADDKRIRTRKWIWRQSDRGKVTADSRNIFFPIDGFMGENCNRMLEARNRLAVLLEKHFGCRVERHVVNIQNNEVEL
jgi:DNA/RNA-binding domain of Phe-tRNA-synthetase-like protein